MTGIKEKEKKKCNVMGCKREVWKNDECCIFHSKNIEGKKKGFNEIFWKEFERQKNEQSKYTFMYFVFPNMLSFREFDKDVSFEAAKFSGEASFYKATFSGEANFGGAKFSGKAIFVEAHFSGKANFRNAKFSKTEFAIFNGTIFDRIANFEMAEFLGRAQFIETVFSGIVCLGRATFSGEELSGLFRSLRNRGIKRICKGKYNIYNFYFHLGEKIAKEYPVIDRMTKDAWYLNDYKNNHPCIYAFWNITAKCGQSMGRWSLWALGIAVTFAFIFYFYYLDSPQNFQTVYVSKGFSLFSFIYYSIVTFTTLGFGDIVPRCGWLQLWVMVEVILGYIMLGGLISIFADKLARRS